MAGFFLSDTGDVGALRAYRLCDSDASCAAAALSAGVDIEQPPGTTYLSLPAAVGAGLVTQAAVDAAVGRVLAHKFSATIFDSPYVDAAAADGWCCVQRSVYMHMRPLCTACGAVRSILHECAPAASSISPLLYTAAIVNSAQHRALALRAAEEGAVLLLNARRTLPLTPSPSLRVAVVGPAGGCSSCLLVSSAALINPFPSRPNQRHRSELVYINGPQRIAQCLRLPYIADLPPSTLAFSPSPRETTLVQAPSL